MSYEVWSFIDYMPLICSAGVTLAARRSWKAFGIASLSLLLMSCALWIATDSVVVRDDGEAGKLGYNTWSVMASLVTATSVLGIWRLISMPGVVAAVVATAASFMVLLMGSWIS
ncbi:MAG: hypothetical protein HOQ32_10520 [Lysobacter sp.]|nr:hypothetical protein [Lysobacter sp.]